MTNNDILRSVRYMLDLSEPAVTQICKLADYDLESAEVANYLRGEEDPEYLACPDEMMLRFLDGLVIYKRGKNESAVPEPVPEKRMSNNIVLKKLRIAFELKEDDMHSVFAKADYQMSKPELSALFRKKGHNNYRACGDQILRYFLKGLTMKLRPVKSLSEA